VTRTNALAYTFRIVVFLTKYAVHYLPDRQGQNFYWVSVAFLCLMLRSPHRPAVKGCRWRQHAR